MGTQGQGHGNTGTGTREHSQSNMGTHGPERESRDDPHSVGHVPMFSWSGSHVPLVVFHVPLVMFPRLVGHVPIFPWSCAHVPLRPVPRVLPKLPWQKWYRSTRGLRARTWCRISENPFGFGFLGVRKPKNGNRNQYFKI